MEQMTEEKAAEMIEEGFHCAQCVMSYGAKILKMDENHALKMAAGLGGGCQHGGTCGAVTGAVVCLGLKYGFSDSALAEQQDKILCEKIERFQSRFAAKHGGLTCCELLGGYNVSVEADYQKIEELGLGEVCPRACATACELLGELL